MTEELKTLKDLEEAGMSLETRVSLNVPVDKLKAEAIKWVKAFDKEIHTCSEFCEECKINSIKKYWIKHFFNLTEEDLE